MAITDQAREHMNCADYCDELSKESYSSAAFRRRLLMTVQHRTRRPGAMNRQQVDKALDDQRRIHNTSG